ncbi:MAG: hypothetical protein ABFS56_05940 [Pseudomonadota bacterium]
MAPDEIHVLSSGGKRYLVVAKKIWDNDLDIFESSLEHFSRPATPKGVRHYPN